MYPRSNLILGPGSPLAEVELGFVALLRVLVINGRIEKVGRCQNSDICKFGRMYR